jgi:hypothetical protein
MKKVLATVAALGLVLGVTATAFALDTPGKASTGEADTMPRVPQATAPGVALWSVSGEWVLAGAYLSNGLGMPGGAAVQQDSYGREAADAFYIYTFKVLPVLQVNDKIAVKGELRFADRDVFGLTDTAKISPVQPVPGSINTGNIASILAMGGHPSDTGGRIIDTYHLYLEWMSPWGKTRFGRTPAGAWGSKFLDNAAQGNRLMLWTNFLPAPWGSLIFTQKISEADAGENLTNYAASVTTTFPPVVSFTRTIANYASDQDKDGYYIDLSYKADFGKTTAAIFAVRTAGSTGDSFVSTNFWLHGKYAFDNLSLEYELNWGFGEASASMDQSSLGFYADLGMKMDDWTIGGLFIFASGDSNTDNDAESAMSNSTGLGKDFNPFQIMTGDYMNLLNGDNPLAGDSIHSAVKTSSTANAGAVALGAYAKYAMSPKMTISGELGYFLAQDEPVGYDDQYGTEIGVGMSYKLYDNLTYNAHFSYLWTGDYFNEANTELTEDIWLAAHALSMKF